VEILIYNGQICLHTGYVLKLVLLTNVKYNEVK